MILCGKRTCSLLLNYLVSLGGESIACAFIFYNEVDHVHHVLDFIYILTTLQRVYALAPFTQLGPCSFIVAAEKRTLRWSHWSTLI